MRFAVISGSREQADARPEWSPPPRQIGMRDVLIEKSRRLKAIKLDEWKVREFVTGRPMPDDVRHLALQIEYAAEAIGRLSPIPADFADDLYWPRVWP
ncbi:hypothetical protein DMC47_05950 [Nostoc sp. 3335mG]|nr:hypothetical protein DMC47_05950 [Nostoc sp. 3335mG]